MAPTLNDYEMQYGDAGVKMNTVGQNFPLIDVTKVSGLDNAPYRVDQRDREGMDGGFTDAIFEQQRVIVIEGTIYADQNDLADIEVLLDNLKANYAPGQVNNPFYFSPAGGRIRQVGCKSLGFKYDWDNGRNIGAVPFQAQLVAEDPTIYSTSLYQATWVPVTGAPTGRGYNRSFNYGYGGAYSGNTQGLVNLGNKSSGLTFVVAGSCTNPRITNDLTGEYIQVNITLGAADTLTIDTRNRTIYLNGTASRRNALAPGSMFFLAQPGTTFVRYLTGSGTATLTATWRDAYR